MPPNSVVPLFDADNDIVYVKSTDGAGFPAIRAFAFQPVEDKPDRVQQYVTRDEFDAAMQAVNMMRNANPEQVMHQMMQVKSPRHSWAYSTTTCRRSTRYGSNYLSNSVKHLSHT